MRKNASHTLNSLRRYTHAHPRSSGEDDDDTKSEPTDSFVFPLKQHLQCTSCAGARHRVDVHDGAECARAGTAREKGRDDEAKMPCLYHL